MDGYKNDFNNSSSENSDKSQLYFDSTTKPGKPSSAAHFNQSSGCKSRQIDDDVTNTESYSLGKIATSSKYELSSRYSTTDATNEIEKSKPAETCCSFVKKSVTPRYGSPCFKFSGDIADMAYGRNRSDPSCESKLFSNRNFPKAKVKLHRTKDQEGKQVHLKSTVPEGNKESPNCVTLPDTSDSSPKPAGVKLPIAGVQVEFPFQPYPVQTYMMSQVITAITKTQNCLLESPTGTGKTLGLLCSSLAWQKHEQRALDALAKEIKQEELKQEKEYEKKIAEENIRKNNIKFKEMIQARQGDYSSDEDTSGSLSSDEDVFQVNKRSKWEKSANKSASDGKDQIEVVEQTREVQSEQDISNTNFLDEEKEGFVEINKSIIEENSTKLGVPEPTELIAPQIFYGTRTHKQIAQVIDQFKGTAYAKDVKMTILGARDHTCINEMVNKHSNITELCQALIDHHHGVGCAYFNGTKQIEGQHDHHYFKELPQVYDIEDMVNCGKKKRFCPYFALRSLVISSNIVFCPYSYLIDPTIRPKMELTTTGSIIIMDEAHNIEDTCREAASLILKHDEIESAVRDCKEIIAKREYNHEHYTVIKDVLQLILDWITSNGPKHLYSNDESTTIFSGQQVIDLFHVEDITHGRISQMEDSFKEIMKSRDQDINEAVISGRVKMVCEQILTKMRYLFEPKNTSKYQAYFSREVSSNNSDSGYGTWFSRHSKNSYEERVWKYTFQIMCLSPEIAFSELLDARTIILASGTLSPMESFQSELGVRFSYIVKGRHVVDPENFFVSSVSSGPRGHPLKGVYENINTYEYQDELGRIIIETAKIVPHGVLCFVPSYSLMDKLKERWETTGLLDELQKLKQIYWEPRRKNDLVGVMNSYTLQIDQSKGNTDLVGAILFGVYRGKISEGIDFSDEQARVVLAVGIPFPNRHANDIKLKLNYNDSLKNSSLSGSKWYCIQAYRALNQALGRCIRHRNDWGAIILVDSRFNSYEVQNNLPRWIRPYIRNHQTWDTYIRNMNAFFNKMKQKAVSPIPQKE